MKNGLKNSGRKATGRPFEKGHKRPGPGRPPINKCVPDLMRWAGKFVAPEKMIAKVREAYDIDAKTEITMDQATVLVIRLMALQGDLKAAEMWMDRTEGKALQSIDMNAPEGPLFVVLPPSSKPMSQPELNLTNATDPHTETV